MLQETPISTWKEGEVMEVKVGSKWLEKDKRIYPCRRVEVIAIVMHNEQKWIIVKSDLRHSSRTQVTGISWRGFKKRFTRITT